MTTTRSFPLEPGAPRTLTVTWDGGFKNLRIVQGEQAVGGFADKTELKRGASFVLADGSTLDVKLEEGLMGRRLVLLRNGSPLPGSDADPAVHLKHAAYAAYAIGALNGVGGIVAMAVPSPILESLGLGIWTVVMGLVYALLGFFVFRGSVVAAGAALTVYVIDSLATFVLGAAAGANPNAMGILVRVLVIGMLLRGLRAARTLRTAAKAQGN